MIQFIVTSDMRASYVIEDDMHISASDVKKIEEITSSVTSDCRFIADLGDCIDGKSSPAESSAALDDIVSCYRQSPTQLHMLMGERSSLITKQGFLEKTGSSMRYRAFEFADYRCIFLDALSGDNGFYIDDEQFDWLSRLLGKTHRAAVIFSHAPIALTDESNEANLISNRKLLRELFENSRKVALVISGHSDKGDLVVSHGVPYITLAPSCASDGATFAKISVSSKGVSGEGFGAQESFSVEKNAPTKKTGTSKFKKLFNRK